MKKMQLKKNDKLAFELAVDMMVKYEKKCEKDSKTKTMNPIFGTYHLINQLATNLLAMGKADGYESFVLEIINDAINDAKDTVLATEGEL